MDSTACRSATVPRWPAGGDTRSRRQLGVQCRRAGGRGRLRVSRRTRYSGHPAQVTKWSATIFRSSESGARRKAPSAGPDQLELCHCARALHCLQLLDQLSRASDSEVVTGTPTHKA